MVIINAMNSVAQPDKTQNTLGTSIRLVYRWSNCYTGESKTHMLSIGIGTIAHLCLPVHMCGAEVHGLGIWCTVLQYFRMLNLELILRHNHTRIKMTS